MLFPESRGLLLRIYTSSILVHARAVRLGAHAIASSPRYYISSSSGDGKCAHQRHLQHMSSRAQVLTAAIPLSPVCRRTTSSAVSMGPLHGSAGVHDKVASIRNYLRENHSSDSAHGLQVIMDFDLTMTAPGSEQCHHMFATSSVLPEQMRKRLLPYLTGQIKMTSRDDWWSQYHDVLAEGRLSRDEVAAVAREADVTLREGTVELMHLLHERKVPLLIVSAGISDVVEETLRARGLYFDNITVRANTMRFGEDDKLESFGEGPPLTSRNKHLTSERESAYFDRHDKRRCVVVVGDRIGDADVTEGVASDDTCLKIGFFDHSHGYPHPYLPPLPLPLANLENVMEDGGLASGQPSRMLPTAEASLIEAAASAAAGTATADASSDGASKALLLERVSESVGGVSPGTKDARGELEETRVISRLKERIAIMDSMIPFHFVDGSAASLGGLKGSQGDVELERHSEEFHAAVAAAEVLLRVYGETFDVVAQGAHSMDIVTDFVRCVISDSVE